MAVPMSHGMLQHDTLSPRVGTHLFPEGGQILAKYPLEQSGGIGGPCLRAVTCQSLNRGRDVVKAWFWE